MKKYLHLFSQIGIDEKMGKIYLFLLEHGRAPISDIAKFTGIHRVEIYRKLPYLLELWLIKEVPIGKRKFYLATSPQKLEDMIVQAQENSERVIEDLIDKYGFIEKRPHVFYSEWVRSITAVFEDILTSLRPGEVFYRISSEIDVEKANTYLPKNYREKRDKKWLERYVIESHKTSTQKKSRPEREVAIMPQGYDQFDENVQMIIYGRKVAYVDYNSESAITIENTKIANFQKKLFKALFQSLKNIAK